MICKTKRIVDATTRHSSDRIFKDIHYKGQSYYEVDPNGTGLYEYHTHGNKIFVSGNLVTSWNWNGSQLGSEEIASKLQENLERPLEYFRCPPEFTCYHSEKMTF